MTLADDDLHMTELPFLEELPQRVRRRLLAKSLVHRVSAGAVLFDQGDVPTFQHIVLSGAVHLFGRSRDGKEVLVEVVEAPDLVLPAAVVTASPCLTQARTLGPARLLLIEASAFRDAVKDEASLANFVIASLSGQSRRLVRQIKSLKLRTANQRVGCYLIELARRQGRDTVTLPHEKGLIASELGITRESFSRALAALQAEGVACRGDVVTIADRARLEAFSGSDPLIDGSRFPGG